MSSGRKAKERVYSGVGVAPGIAIGQVYIADAETLKVPNYRLGEEDVPGELERLRQALDKSRRQLKALQRKSSNLPPAAAEEITYILEAYLHMLTGSRLVRGAEERIRERRQNAEAAVQREISEIARGFASLADSYMSARADDVREVGRRVIRNLARAPRRAFLGLPEDSVIIGEELTPADTALKDPKAVVGFATILGGAEGHTAIMARSLGLPAVLGVPGLLQGLQRGDAIVVDGDQGRVIVNPSAETLAAYRQRKQAHAREMELLGALRDKEATTLDGRKIGLQANLELPREAELALAMGAEGIGLLRTEFMFMNRDDAPGEDEQYAMLSGVVRLMDGRPVTVRTLDVGGDKLAQALEPAMHAAANPALAGALIRFSLKNPDLFETQLRAILRASMHGPLRILLPMISTTSEIRQARKLLERVARDLRAEGLDLPEELPPLGVMIEIPGAALCADGLAREAAFFAIGSNDLTMYTLAADRGDEQVAHLYNPLHPSVLKLIDMAVQAARRAGIPVSLCGEMAGNPRYAALLCGLGVHELSMAASAIPQVKQRLLKLDLKAAESRAGITLQQPDSGRVATLVDDMNGLA